MTRGLSELSGPSDYPVRSELSESDSDSDKNYPSVSDRVASIPDSTRDLKIDLKTSILTRLEADVKTPT